MSSSGCTEFRELAPELALGIADGEDRASALEHLTGCAECRRYLDELSLTADELLVLTPEREPPLGFEERVLEAVRPAPRPERRRRFWLWRPLPVAATAAAVAAVVAGGMFFAYRDDHHVASEYRSTLAEAHGNYFTASALRAPGGAEVGQVFTYQGKPSWVMVTANGDSTAMPPGRYACQVVTSSGHHRTVGWIRMDEGQGSYGHAVRMDLDRIAQVRLLGPGRGTVLEANLSRD